MISWMLWFCYFRPICSEHCWDRFLGFVGILHWCGRKVVRSMCRRGLGKAKLTGSLNFNHLPVMDLDVNASVTHRAHRFSDLIHPEGVNIPGNRRMRHQIHDSDSPPVGLTTSCRGNTCDRLAGCDRLFEIGIITTALIVI